MTSFPGVLLGGPEPFRPYGTLPLQGEEFPDRFPLQGKSRVAGMGFRERQHERPETRRTHSPHG